MTDLAKAFSPVLITGATGFVGACLARRLCALGFDVHIFARADSRRWRLQDIESRLHIHTCDLTDHKGVQRAVAAIRPVSVYHLAAFGAYFYQSDPMPILDTCVHGTLNLLQSCRESPCKVFVNAGSSSEYGFKSEPMRETDCLEPNSIYAVGKSAQTHLCSYTARTESRAINTLRLFSVYGPYEEPTRLMPTLITRAMAGEELRMVAADTARDFVYVDDVLDAMLQLERMAELKGEVFNIGTGRQSTMRQVVDIALDATDSKSKVAWNAMPPRIWDAASWVADVTHTAKVLGWRARTSVADGINKLATWHEGEGREATLRWKNEQD